MTLEYEPVPTAKSATLSLENLSSLLMVTYVVWGRPTSDALAKAAHVRLPGLRPRAANGGRCVRSRARPVPFLAHAGLGGA